MSTPPAVAYYSPRMGFLIQGGDDKADYGAIIDALLKTDGASGLVLCTESTKPTTNLFPGMYIKCTDSLKHYIYSGGSFSSGVYSGGTWTEDLYVTVVSVASGNGNMIYSGNDGTTRTYTADNGSATATFGPYNSFSIATVSINQVVKFEIELTCNITLPSSYTYGNWASYGPKVYITIDGTDYFVGWLNIPINGTTSMAQAKLSRSIVVPTSGTHTVTYKMVNANAGNTSGVISYVTLNVINSNITAMASVA
jgi:hypothetical protein